MSAIDVLVLGLGNVLMGDEGVGVRVALALTEGSSAAPMPASVRVVDGGTLGLDLLPLLEDADRLVMIDAVDLGEAPGTVRVLRDEELHARMGGAISVHQLGVGDLLAVARLRGTLPTRTTLVGIQPQSIEVGLELSEAVGRSLSVAIDLVRSEVHAMGRSQEVARA